MEGTPVMSEQPAEAAGSQVSEETASDETAQAEDGSAAEDQDDDSGEE